MWRPQGSTGRNHSRCPHCADTTKDREAAAQGQPTWEPGGQSARGAGDPHPQEEGSLLKGPRDPHPGRRGQPAVGTDEHTLPGWGVGVAEAWGEPRPKGEDQSAQRGLTAQEGAVNWGKGGGEGDPGPERRAVSPGRTVGLGDRGTWP